MESEGSLQEIAAGNFCSLVFCACVFVSPLCFCVRWPGRPLFFVVVFVVVFHLVFADVVLHKSVRATSRKKVRPQREGGGVGGFVFLCVCFGFGSP